MLRLLALAAVLGLSLAQPFFPYTPFAWPYGGWAVPLQDIEEEGPKPCPQAPARPEGVKGCNWIAIQDSRGCIIDYECEPKGPEPCPSTPMQPEDSARCRWTAIKNAKGCIIDYECEPRRPYGFPIASAPIAAPLPIAPAAYPYAYNPLAAYARRWYRK